MARNGCPDDTAAIIALLGETSCKKYNNNNFIWGLKDFISELLDWWYVLFRALDRPTAVGRESSSLLNRPGGQKNTPR